MEIEIAQTDEEIADCFAVLRELRPQLDRASFVADVRRMQQQGYILAYLKDGEVASVAGYRFFEMFAFGPTLYVDDLVTDANRRSSGYGERLLEWLKAEAIRNNCKFLTLDSGLKRLRAHEFYRRNGLQEIAFHFAAAVDGGAMWSSE